MKYIELKATSKRVSLLTYVQGVRQAIASPAQTFKHGLTTWWPVTGADIRREFRHGITERINRHLPGYGVGRKYSDDWQRSASRVAGNLNGQRILTMINQCPKELRRRLSHRLYRIDDL
ncbi:hypothetical protein [Agrobacterium tumefaciens]|uniref:hypothetical protein n=1 Tax=Agrobacterium tumefaciens TaxID=358 RepID=UPI001658F83E|nr:hypothetical protein [Agrobacterium tumefaciens]QNP78370.1 hypothetical protein IAI05_07335 [Agrobacterium tumefaciens]